MPVKSHIITVDKLRPLFTYDYKGVPLLSGYGQFINGLSNEEIDTYLKVRANTTHIASYRRKFNIIAGCNTCPTVTLNGKLIVLMYRHDVERFANKLFDGTPTYFD